MDTSQAGQNYKIYVNDSVLTLCHEDDARPDMGQFEDSIQLRYFGQVKTLHNVMDNLEKSTRPREIIVVSDDLERLFNDYVGLFKWVEAGGGVVEHDDGTILAIYRRKRWDLPKGKLDPGESFEEAAVREVIEETGLADVDSHDLVISTLHTFRTKKDDRALKLTKWYHMTTTHKKLRLQADEGIEDARWLTPAELLSGGEYNIYTSIKGVVKQYLEYKGVKSIG